MSESSGTPSENLARGSLPQFFPSRTLPAPHSGDHNYLGRGMGVEQKTSFGSISSLWRALALFSCKRGLAFCSVIGCRHRHAMADLSRLLFLGALLLTACTTATSPNLYRVTELVPGISTRDDAIAKLGPPSSTSNIGNNTILQWGGNNSPVHLAISFGMDGRMIQAATDAQKLDQLSGATQ